MGDIARCSLGKPTDYYNEDLLYNLFGVNAELLIDHAWGYEPCTMKDVKAYKPENRSLCSGQVLHCPYNYEKTKLIVYEMTDLLVLDLVKKHLQTNQIVLTVGYDVDNLKNNRYKGKVTIDRYGRKVPKHAHGTINLDKYTSSTKVIMEKVNELFERIINKELLTRRIYITANNLKTEDEVKEAEKNSFEQINLFTNLEQNVENEKKEKKENSLQHAMIDIKSKFGKNAILRGMNFVEGGTTIQRNKQVGGHSE
jgi:DNA polymerase V